MISVGEIVKQKKGGGSYTIIGTINCPRKSCQKEIEIREQRTPNKASRRNGYYWSQWSLCPHCGLYDNSSGKKIYIKDRVVAEDIELPTERWIYNDKKSRYELRMIEDNKLLAYSNVRIVVEPVIIAEGGNKK